MIKYIRIQSLCLYLFLVLSVAAGPQSAHALTFGSAKVDAITFAAAPGLLFVPVEVVVRKLRWTVGMDKDGRLTSLNGQPIEPAELRTLLDGTPLVSVAWLQKAGAAVSAPAADGAVTVGRGWRRLVVRPAAQRVVVSLPQQQLEGWQGNTLVLKTNISSGKNGGTPAGEFKAGPYRAKMHRSSLYNNAPMPWSVQINGHIFVHGYTSVPNYPASHGCIRMPLTGNNPARFFYEWVQTGTPVSVQK